MAEAWIVSSPCKTLRLLGLCCRYRLDRRQEYQDLFGRDVWMSATTSEERWQVLAALARVGHWVPVYYGWRPSLRDEGDNHLIELAIAGHAQAVVTHNVRDLTRGELAWPHLRILTPAQFLEELP